MPGFSCRSSKAVWTSFPSNSSAGGIVVSSKIGGDGK
jgi:hypothetical protein